jgi:hypothetical protein
LRVREQLSSLPRTRVRGENAWVGYQCLANDHG